MEQWIEREQSTEGANKAQKRQTTLRTKTNTQRKRTWANDIPGKTIKMNNQDGEAVQLH